MSSLQTVPWVSRAAPRVAADEGCELAGSSSCEYFLQQKIKYEDVATDVDVRRTLMHRHESAL